MFTKVEHTTYSKDIKTGGVVNNDTSGYVARKKVITRNRKQDNRIDLLESRISDLMNKLEQLTGA